jgi:hypothetical protein
MHSPTVLLDRIFDILPDKHTVKFEDQNIQILKNNSATLLDAHNVDLVVVYKKNLQDWNDYHKKVDCFIVIDDNSLNLSNIPIEKIFNIPANEFTDVGVFQAIRAHLYQKTHNYLQLIEQRLQKDSRFFLKDLKEKFASISFDKTEQKRLQELLIYEQTIFSSLDANKAASAFEDAIQKCLGQNYVSLIDFKLVEIDELNHLYFSSTHKSLATHYRILNYKSLSPFEIFCVGRLIYAHLEFLDKVESDKQNNSIEHSEIFKQFLHQLDYPYAMFMQEELVVYNPAYIQLKLVGRDCLRLKDHEKISIDDQVFEVLIKDVDVNQQIHRFYFFKYDRKSNDLSFAPSNEELGIVSSSIAHELNNPLAGILAAVEVLLLEDKLDPETTLELREIKNGAMRCKQLVETFLGFSRANPLRRHLTNTNLQSNNQSASTFRESIDRALSLLRFRLIESNTKIETHFITRNEFNGSINPSIFAMILYLFLGNLVTHYSHYLLIAVDYKDQPLKLDFIEDLNSFSIQIKSTIQFDQKTISSKLTEHLLEMENFNIRFDERVIIFEVRPQLSL